MISIIFLVFVCVCVLSFSEPVEKEVQSFNAEIRANCKDYGTLFRSDDGGITVVAEVTEPSWNDYTQTQVFQLTGVTKRTIIKIRCRASNGLGGFVAQTKFLGKTYVTNDGGSWKLYTPSLQIAGLKDTDIQYIPKDNLFQGTTSTLDASAKWISIYPHSSLDFYFRFRQFLRGGLPYDDDEEQDIIPWYDPLVIAQEEQELEMASVRSMPQQFMTMQIQYILAALAVVMIASVSYACYMWKKQGEYKPLIESNQV